VSLAVAEPSAPDRIEPLLARLHGLHPKLIDLSLDRLRRLLAHLGHPEQRLPPVLHVAGTNGKGSTCAFARAVGEAAGLRVHVYTSPHLVRFRERVRLAGTLASDAALSDALERAEAANAGQPITVFEMMTAAALLLFAETPADLCVLEVGLGGRGDATNVVDHPAACAVSSLSLDHREMLGDTLALIAREKAGIFKPGVPAATGAQPGDALAVLQAEADRLGAPLLARGRDWHIALDGHGARYEDARGTLRLPCPALPGDHQLDNAGIAVAMLRASGLPLPIQAYAGIAAARWPGRMQRLTGRLAALLPAGWELWLDGGHNPGAGQALARVLADWPDRPAHLVVGMKQGKDAADFLGPLLPHVASVWAVHEPGQHLAMPIPDVIAASGGAAQPGPTVADALRQLRGPPARVLVCGSLYLAGEVLKADGWEPD
jgi:dihydrofolate synthase/folylpolyglutamate synthase